MTLRQLLAVVRVAWRNLRGVKFEPEVLYLRHLVGRGDTCLHIGASDGRHSYAMSQLAPQGRIHAFEPSSHNFRVLRAVIGLHGLGNVTPIHAAVADRAGRLRLVTPIKDSGRRGRAFAFVTETGKTATSRSEVRSIGADVEEVESVAIDDFCRDYGIERVDFIRCDVEGAEMKVLAGARRVIERDLPSALIEIHPVALAEHFGSNGQAVADVFLGLGYRMYHLHGTELVEGRTVPGDLAWRDYFFVHPARAAELPEGPFKAAAPSSLGSRRVGP